MDYKKKYEEALKRAKKYYDRSKLINPAYVLNIIFPELAESEDERIRNLIRRIVISTNDGDLQCLGDDDTKKCLAWLEKQAEQKPAEWSEEDEKYFDSIIESYKELIKDYSANHGVDYIPYNTPVVARTVVNDIKLIKSLRPKPHWKPSKEQMRALWEIYQGGKAQAPIASLYEDLKKL